jgi:hypothetical protein
MRTDTPPTGPSDGFPIADKPNAPNSVDSVLLTDLTAGTTYHYAAFTYDAMRNYSTGVTAGASPGSVADFDADGDVDIADFAHLQACFGTFIGPACQDADFQGDTVVDALDFAAFLPCMNGARRPPGC